MAIGSKIIHKEELTSTNTYALSLLNNEKPPEGTIIQADFQTAGRGQPGNSWESAKGKNLLFSIILYPEMIRADEQFLVSMALSLGIYDFVSRHADGCSIKWPNDIYVNNDKIAGILIESSTMGPAVKFMVAGIGVNINQEKFVSSALNPVSLKQLTGIDYDTGLCMFEIANDLNLRYRKLEKNPEETIDAYHENLFWRGIPMQFTDSRGKFTGIIKKVDNDGRLTIETDSGNRGYYFKEVEFML